MKHLCRTLSQCGDSRGCGDSAQQYVQAAAFTILAATPVSSMSEPIKIDNLLAIYIA